MQQCIIFICEENSQIEAFLIGTWENKIRWEEGGLGKTSLSCTPVVCRLFPSCCLVKNDANIQCVSFLSFNLAILVFWIAAGSSSDNPVFSSVFCEQGFLSRCLAFRCSSQFAWHSQQPHELANNYSFKHLRTHTSTIRYWLEISFEMNSKNSHKKCVW